MRKIYVLVALAIIGILGSCAVVNAAENIIDLGTIEYSNTYEEPLPNVGIDSTVKIDNETQRVILSYMYSEIDQSAIFVTEPYLTNENKTIYTFIAKHIEVDWWFINDTRVFIYQDNATKTLYRVNIDYSDITIPDNPVLIWKGLHNETSANLTELQKLFNETFKKLNETRIELQERWDFYNQSKGEFDNNSALVITLKENLSALNTKYNETEILWINATTNLSLYQTWYGTLGRDYDKLEEEHNALSGILPVYVFFAIIGTAMVVVFIFKRKKILGEEQKSAFEIERDTGYTPKASAIDNLFKGIKNAAKGKKKEAPPEQKQESEPDMENIYKKIDGIKSENDAFRKSIVMDFRVIETRVDAIETKLETKTGE